MGEMELTKFDDDKDTTELDKIVEELKSHPAFMTKYDPSQPMSEAMEGLQILKYDSGDMLEKAQSYKEDGNYNFQKKKYHWAITSYGEGLKCKCDDKELNSVLHANRAASNFRLGNYRSALADCRFAVVFNPKHMKAIVRAADCCFHLKRPIDCIKWCDKGLSLESDHDILIQMKLKAEKVEKELQRDERKRLAKLKKEQKTAMNLINILKKREVTFAGAKIESIDNGENAYNFLMKLKYSNPHTSTVCLIKNDPTSLSWPVVFLYPEYQQSDFVTEFHENSTFFEHIMQMFFHEHPSWDLHGTYQPDSLSLFFEKKGCYTGVLFQVDKKTTLRQILENPNFIVHDGIPSFIFLVENSDFGKMFLSKYDVVSL